MTNKEDLKTLLEYFYYQGKTPIIPKEQVEFILNNLEKDLEVLEILKKYTTTQQHTHNVWFDNEFFINGKKCSEKEYEMVRGELENGKH